MIVAARRGAAEPLLICAGLAAAMALRLGWPGTADSAAITAGLVGAAAMLLVAAAAGWRPGRPTLRSLLVGLGGAAVLLLVPVVLRLAVPPVWHVGGPISLLPGWAAGVAVVATAEEVLLRGALMGALLRRGRPEVAVAVAAVAFALLHVPMYGWGAVPLDLAVGVWLGGLRLASGGVAAPATAHTLADLAAWWLR